LSTCKGVVTALRLFPIMLLSFSSIMSNATTILFAIIIAIMLPAQSPGAFPSNN
jgi:hypothetical protein